MSETYHATSNATGRTWNLVRDSDGKVLIQDESFAIVDDVLRQLRVNLFDYSETGEVAFAIAREAYQ